MDVLHEDVSIGTVAAGDYREDLLAAGIGNGMHGFRFPLPKSVNSDCVKIMIAGTDIELPRRESKPASVPEYYRLFAPLLSNGVWCVDEIALSESTLRFAGWALRPLAVPAALCTFFVNGRPCQSTRFPMPHPAAGRRFPYVPDSGESGFCCSAQVLPEDEGAFELAFGHGATKRAFREEYNQHFTIDDLPLPEPERRERVHGSRDEASFRLEGFSAYCKLEKALRRAGRSYDDCPRILDWGCGCGRVTRYFARNRRSFVHGVDIDSDNIGWCRRNLAFGSFATVPLHPPPVAPAERFSLAIGISVFTHLREDAMLEWLQWLARVLEPDGLAMVSLHSDFAWARSAAMPEHLYQEWRSKGILDELHNAALESVLAKEDRSYYRNTFHTSQYLNATWSRYFDILEVLPGYIGNLQDLVIMRSKQAAGMGS